jgi:hypothetical protein
LIKSVFSGFAASNMTKRIYFNIEMAARLYTGSFKEKPT